MVYLIDGKKIDIPTEKPYGQGSEGLVFKKGDFAYKIYHQEMLNENYGNKENFHKYLLNIPTKQVILPDKAIFSTTGEYVGYRAPLITGAKRKHFGITKLPKEELIKNLQILEDDFSLLSENYVLAADVSPVNYIYTNDTKTMNIIDPGRYRHHCLEDKDSYARQNNKQLDKLIELLLYLDFLEYKPISTKRKIQELKELIKRLKNEKNYSYRELFESITDYETIDDYAKSLKKYIR